MLGGLYSRLADKLFSVKKYKIINIYCLNGTHQEARDYFWLFSQFSEPDQPRRTVFITGWGFALRGL